MCAGKSKLCAELLENISNNILFFKPDIYIKDINQSRPHSRCSSANKIFLEKIKNNHEFISTNNKNSIIESLKKIRENNIKTIIFEEAQFFDKDLKDFFYQEIVKLIHEINGIRILISYLNFDFNKNKFGFMNDIHKLLLKDKRIYNSNLGFVKLNAYCNNMILENKNCEKAANFTCRYINSTNDLSQLNDTYFQFVKIVMIFY